jgi:hypothetical protein
MGLFFRNAEGAGLFYVFFVGYRAGIGHKFLPVGKTRGHA